MKLMTLAPIFIALVSPIACKATGGGQGGEGSTLQAASSEPEEPILVCSASQGARPRLELEVFSTGFDPQLGMTVEVVVKNGPPAFKDDLVLNGHGQVSDESLEMLFDDGRLTASADAAPNKAPGYDGNLELGDGEARPVHCL